MSQSKIPLAKIFKQAAVCGAGWATGGLLFDVTAGMEMVNWAGNAVSNFGEAAIVTGIVSLLYERGGWKPDYAQGTSKPAEPKAPSVP